MEHSEPTGDLSESFERNMLHLLNDCVKENSIVVSMTPFKGRHGTMPVVEAIANRCGPDIVRVMLHGFYMDLNQCSDKPNKEKILRLMGQINELSFHHTQLLNSAQIFELSTQLNKIHLWNTSMDTSTLAGFIRKYPLLRMLWIQQENISSDDLGKLLELNHTIQCLRLLGAPLSQEVIDIASRLPELTDVVIRVPTSSYPDIKLNPLGTIAKLKQLHLIEVDVDNDLLEELARNKTLISLELFGGTVPNDFQKQLAKFENLHILKIIYVKLENGEIPLEVMFPYLVNELPKLCILNVETERPMLNAELIRVIRSRTKDSELILLWNCYYGEKVKLFKLKNVITVGPVEDGAVTADFNIDLVDNISTIFETARGFAAACSVVRLDSAILDLMQFK